uniref:JmjC domain-containing protein n=1 Tax=Oryza rufipogon TaxID=4529 RepID=A0A0E0N353_ORYRU
MRAEDDDAGGGEFVGARLDAGLRAARFASPPSADEFAAAVEPRNAPAVFRGVVKDWTASSRWDPRRGGLDYLRVWIDPSFYLYLAHMRRQWERYLVSEKVGPDVDVEAMMSSTGHVFYGDLRSHERAGFFTLNLLGSCNFHHFARGANAAYLAPRFQVLVPFSKFMNSCKSYLRCPNASSDSPKAQEILKEPASSEEGCSSSLESCDQVYLAQVSILNTENKERCSLEVLKEDIQEPTFLRGKPFSSINIWMNRAHLRSSTHYDPHHNLLCVVAGCKKVTLWPPSSSPYLYPMPVYGEASNHSSVSIEEPDYSRYTRARYMKEYSERVILNCGDALFIPEGWYHQVDSDDLTIAINFWWKSRIMNEMLEHMDAYYLRRILSRLVDKEMNKMVQENSVSCSKGTTVCQPTDEESGGPEQLKQKQVNSDSSDKKDSPLQTLEPSTLQALYELISLVHNSAEMVSQNEITEPTSQDAYCKQSNGSKKIAADDSSLLEKDPIAKIILPLKPLELQSMLLAMARTFPRTLEALVLNMLGPIGAEILTRKFDEMDQQATKEQQSEFYKTFYSVFDDQYAAMDALLNGKEMFSFQVFQSVLRQYIGVTLAGLVVLTKGQ